MKIKDRLKEFIHELKDFFTPRYDFEILYSEYKSEYWVLNKEGDLIYRSRHLCDCHRFIKMNTRSK